MVGPAAALEQERTPPHEVDEGAEAERAAQGVSLARILSS